MLKRIQNQKKYIAALLWLRALSSPLCTQSVHGPLAPQGGLKSQKFQIRPPNNVKIDSKLKKFTSQPYCACVHVAVHRLGAIF